MASEHRGPDVVAPPPLLYAAPLVGGLLLDRLLPLPSLPRGLTRPLGLAALAGGLTLTGWAVSTMARAGIALNAVAPGIVATPMSTFLFATPEQRQATLARVPQPLAETG